MVSGNLAATCQFPSVVSVVAEGVSICTGTLIHPEVVLTAAHCLVSGYLVTGVAFGEAMFPAGPPVLEIGATCTAHPDYTSDGSHDVGYCRLDSPAEVEPTPLLAGCERDVLTLGQSVVIAGYGANFATWIPDTGQIEVAEGQGTKRFVAQTVDAIDNEGFGEITLVGAESPQSACFGDSGGPGFVRLADGSWRTWGAGSHLVGELPAPPLNVCGYGTAYANASLVLPWLEGETGLDLTPCWDGDTPVPEGPGCGGFPTEIHHDHGDWADACSGGPTAGSAGVCGPFAGAFDPQPADPDPTDPTAGGEDSGDDAGTSDSTTDTGGGGSTSDGAEGLDAANTGGAESGGADESPTGADGGGDTAAEGDGTGESIDGDSSSGQDAGAAGESGGCSCRAPTSLPLGNGWAWAMLGLGTLVRRRPRSPCRPTAGGR